MAIANSTIVVQPKTPREGTYIFLAQNLSQVFEYGVYKMLWIKMQCRTHVSFIRCHPTQFGGFLQAGLQAIFVRMLLIYYDWC